MLLDGFHLIQAYKTIKNISTRLQADKLRQKHYLIYTFRTYDPYF
jgi:predicted RNA-binding protein with PIN domain